MKRSRILATRSSESNFLGFGVRSRVSRIAPSFTSASDQAGSRYSSRKSRIEIRGALILGFDSARRSRESVDAPIAA